MRVRVQRRDRAGWPEPRIHGLHAAALLLVLPQHTVRGRVHVARQRRDLLKQRVLREVPTHGVAGLRAWCRRV